jgi:hypothetical protein
MEGFVLVKTRFSMKKVWMVLDGQDITYYEKFDSIEQQPHGLKGALNIEEASVSKLDRDALPNGIKVKSYRGKLTFAALDEQQWSYWYMALCKATTLHLREQEQQQKLESMKNLLEIDSSTPLSKGVISKSYKRLSLKAHPDKGGDATKFQEIREAYNALLALQTELDDSANSEIVQYEATIEKKPGVGLGISVSEDPMRKQLLVTNVHPQTFIRLLSEESQGEIRNGDALIGIGKDDCTRWTLLRVKARLDNSRLPFGDSIILTFERRLPRQYKDSDNVDNTPITPLRSTKTSSKEYSDHTPTYVPKFTDSIAQKLFPSEQNDEIKIKTNDNKQSADIFTPDSCSTSVKKEEVMQVEKEEETAKQENTVQEEPIILLQPAKGIESIDETVEYDENTEEDNNISIENIQEQVVILQQVDEVEKRLAASSNEEL